MRKLITALLVGFISLSVVTAEESNTVTIVAYKTISVNAGNKDVAVAHLAKRLAHIQNLVQSNDALTRSSYVGGQLVGIQHLLNEGKLLQAAEALDVTEARLRRYKLWVPPDREAYQNMSIKDIVDNTSTNSP